MDFLHSDLQILSFWLVLFQLGMCCYLTGFYLARTNELHRRWTILLWLVVAAGNAAVLIPFKEADDILQGLVYVPALGLAALLPAYFINGIGITRFKGYYPIAAIGLGIYLLPILIHGTLSSFWEFSFNKLWAYLLCIPSLYLVFFWWLVLGKSYQQLMEQRERHQKENFIELWLALVRLLPWTIAILAGHWKITHWTMLLLANSGFTVSAIWQILTDARNKSLGTKLSRHEDTTIQLHFYRQCQLFGLTKRETEVAELLCAGLTYREIGDQLFISQHTVDNHVQRIFSKSGVKRKIELYQKLRPVNYSN